MNKSIAITVLTWNDWKNTIVCLESIFQVEAHLRIAFSLTIPAGVVTSAGADFLTRIYRVQPILDPVIIVSFTVE